MTEDYFLENLNICNVTYNTSKSMLIYLDLTVTTRNQPLYKYHLNLTRYQHAKVVFQWFHFIMVEERPLSSFAGC